ncbi:hypothetical protein PXK01_03865 [Phaeobacter sp. PT47_59]|uniref:hypothetical protein n=1 Tax=Phaeobacter sp. PT47_59 TaxID=3029979 RepID=UPI002380B53B|nr:hypothetical protein [Phaeobacter sp. PT47_59]MDE4173277.1 hypothetical protein [Phaeobacter sp. PT47_59]
MFWRASYISLFLLIAAPLGAHSPYYTQVEPLQPDGSGFALKLLNGDGVVGSDPVRAVIVDEAGHARAISPLGVSLHISCLRGEGTRRCVVYDGISAEVFEPDPGTWETRPVIEQDGKPMPTAYPEHMGQSFGFLVRSATWAEILLFEASKIISSPISACLALLWWTAIASLLTFTFWRIGRPDFRGAATVLWAVLRLAAAAGLFSATVKAWGWAPYSPYYAAFFAMSGALCALVLTRPRQHAQVGKHPIRE